MIMIWYVYDTVVYLYLYMHMYIYMNMYAYMLLRSTTQYYVVIVLRSTSTVGYGGDHTMGVGGGDQERATRTHIYTHNFSMIKSPISKWALYLMNKPDWLSNISHLVWDAPLSKLDWHWDLDTQLSLPIPRTDSMSWQPTLI